MRATWIVLLVALAAAALFFLDWSTEPPPPTATTAAPADGSQAAIAPLPDDPTRTASLAAAATPTASTHTDATDPAMLAALVLHVVGERGEAIADCSLCAQQGTQPAKDAPTTARTDEHGTATMHLPPGRHRLEVAPTGPHYAPTIGYVRLENGGTEVTIVLARRGELPFHVQLLLAEPPTPLAAAPAMLHRRTGEPEQVLSDSAGRLQVFAEPRDCTLAIPAGANHAQCFVVPVPGHETPAKALRVRLPALARLVVTVVDGAGTPLADQPVHVALRTEDATFPAGAWTRLELPAWEGRTDADGVAIAAQLPAGVRAIAALATDREPRPESAECRLVAGDNAVVVRVEECGIRGRLGDDAGVPLAGVEVGIEYWPDGDPPPVMRGRRGGPRNVRTDGEGRFSFQGLGPGPWIVGVVPDPTAEVPLEPACTKVVLTTTSVADVELRSRPGGWIDGSTIGADGAPLGGVGVDLLTGDDAARYLLGARSDAGGRLRLGPLPRGEWLLATDVFDGRMGLLTPVRVRTGDGNVRLVLHPVMVDVQIRVLDATGLPRRAWVQLRHRDTGDGLGLGAGLDGRAEHAGLRAGTWDVLADDEAGGAGLLDGIRLAPGERPTQLEIRLQPAGTLVVRCQTDEHQEVFCRRGEHVAFADLVRPGEVRRINLPPGRYEVELRAGHRLLRRASAQVVAGQQVDVVW